jgi:hypothetical protein
MWSVIEAWHLLPRWPGALSLNDVNTPFLCRRLLLVADLCFKQRLKHYAALSKMYILCPLCGMQLQALPARSLREGEAQAVPQIWGDAFVAAVADASQHGGGERGRAGGGGYLGGDGGRRIKRVIRDFAEGHRT